MGTAILLATPFIPLKKIASFFNPNYDKVRVENVLYDEDKKKKEDFIKIALPKEEIEKAFKDAEKYMVK